jgi:hypothetical protein
MHIDEATLEQLASELERADVALAIQLSAKESRRWAKYRKAVWAEIKRRTPVEDAIARMTDAELMAELAK